LDYPEMTDAAIAPRRAPGPGSRSVDTAEEASCHDERHKQVAVAVVVEEHCHLVAVVALVCPLSPAVALDACNAARWAASGELR
jgi:hypothetical protein